MKISNETKVGAITVVSITLLILGFNLLKGKKFFSNNTTIIGLYGNVHGLANSNPITINGLQVGSVYSISTQKNMRRITVEMNITKDIEIPDNSVAVIKPNPLGTTSIDIKLGNSTTFLGNRDTIPTDENAGLLDDVLKKMDPVLYEVKRAVSSLDTLIDNFNLMLDPRAKNNVSAVLENLNNLSASLTRSSTSLEILLNTQTGALAKTLNNLNAVTANLAQNNPKISNTLTNLEKTTSKLAALDLNKTLDTLDLAVNNFKNVVDQINTSKGTLGKVLNDPALYNNLASTGNKLNLLMDDIRVNPKRYFNVTILSIFGKKKTKEPLSVPLPDTVNSPYIIKKIDD